MLLTWLGILVPSVFPRIAPPSRRRYNGPAMPVPAFRRKNIRLPAERYLGRGLYLITLCFHRRRRFGANPRIALRIIDELRTHSATREFFVHAYCVMPDHLHALVAGASETSNLLKFVTKFKQETAAEFAAKTHRPLWQFKFYDHILRRADSADRVAWYIWANPVRKGLCGTPTEYPFLGSFTQIGSRMLESKPSPKWTPPWQRHTPEKAETKMPG
ncbi:MAG TPA: transposase [Candidatus Acidoferrales bacterium]|jgi:putative transposase|nr:transposase [Candidatus Acidoferrales bacterium]